MEERWSEFDDICISLQCLGIGQDIHHVLALEKTMSAWEEFVVSRKRRSVQECVGGRCPDT